MLFLLLDVAEIADEVYMEVIVGEEDAAATHEQQMDDSEIKSFMPIAWAAAYGRSLFSKIKDYLVRILVSGLLIQKIKVIFLEWCPVFLPGFTYKNTYILLILD